MILTVDFQLQNRQLYTQKYFNLKANYINKIIISKEIAQKYTNWSTLIFVQLNNILNKIKSMKQNSSIDLTSKENNQTKTYFNLVIFINK